MKLGKLTNIAFRVALARLNTQPLPLKTAFKLKGISAKIQEELRRYEDVRQDTLQRLGEKDESGTIRLNEDGTVMLSAENLEVFARELSELNETEVPLDALSLKELGDNIQIAAEDLMLLDELVVEATRELP